MSPVLHYFGIPARGEATRVALAVAGVDFVDKRMAFEDLPACRFKTVPVYEVRDANNEWSLRAVCRVSTWCFTSHLA